MESVDISQAVYGKVKLYLKIKKFFVVNKEKKNNFKLFRLRKKKLSLRSFSLKMKIAYVK